MLEMFLQCVFHTTFVIATLEKGLRSWVQWNWTFLFVKSFKFVSRPFRQGSKINTNQIKLWFSSHAIILEENSIGLDKKKKSFKESSWFGEPKCNLGSKVTQFFVFCFFSIVFFYLLLLEFCDNGRHAEDIVESTWAPQFWTNSKGL